MKKFILMCYLVAGVIATAYAQAVNFKIDSGMEDNASLKAEIEQNVSNLLSEVNRATFSASELNYDTIKITEDAKKSFTMLWTNARFICLESEIAERALQTACGYQVRNIPLELDRFSEDGYQEAVIDLNQAGEITGFSFAISNRLYYQVMKYADEESEIRRRQQILDYVERLHTAYYQKDIEFLSELFGNDDAIVITGKITTSKPAPTVVVDKKRANYQTMSKQSYLENLRRVFALPNRAKATISEIKIQRHPTESEFYGVRIRQGYSVSNFSDEGYIYLLWDFADEQHPQIRVHPWQPLWLDASKSIRIPEDEIFNIGDFDIDMLKSNNSEE